MLYSVFFFVSYIFVLFTSFVMFVVFCNEMGRLSYGILFFFFF